MFAGKTGGRRQGLTSCPAVPAPRGPQALTPCMIRSELIGKLQSRAPTLTHDDAKAVVSEILMALASALVAGNRIEIRDFGSFSLTYRRARTGRNPKSGDTVQVPGKHVPSFKSGKALRDRVNS